MRNPYYEGCNVFGCWIRTNWYVDYNSSADSTCRQMHFNDRLLTEYTIIITLKGYSLM